MKKTIFNYHNLQYAKTKTKKQHIDKIYVIALPQHIKQKELISNYFNKYNIKFNFFDAIDGYSDKEICNYYDDYLSWSFNDTRTHYKEKQYRTKLIKSPAAIGLLKTYEKIFEENILQKNINNILIFEDDIMFDKNINQKLDSIMNNIQNIDMLYLGCSQHIWPNDIKFINIYNNSNNTALYKAPKVIDGSFATLFNRKIFKPLLNSIKEYNAPIDLCMRDVVQNNNCFVAYPNIAIADTTRVSSISKVSRNLRFHKNKVRWNLQNIDFSRGILKVSIIIANYNSEKTIRYTLDSIKKQTYPNYEIIVVDDNSTDNCINIIKNWMDDNKNITLELIQLQNNIGAYGCRNIALNNSDGFFITLLDSDDVFLPQKLENDVYNYFNHENNEMFFSHMYRSQNILYDTFNDMNKLLDSINLEREPYKKLDNYPWNYKFRFGLPTIFVEKDFFYKYGQWNEEYRFGMDIELVQRYLVKKYNIFLNHKDAFLNIYNNNCSQYGIYLSNNMNYVSFPMNNNNATNLCKNEERENIHEIINDKLLRMIK